jgi:hypothetical protein
MRRRSKPYPIDGATIIRPNEDLGTLAARAGIERDGCE